MVINKLKAANEDQKGAAFMLVLIALALGSLVITPTINNISTGLIESRVSEEQMLEQYTADAVIEYTLWQLQYNVDGMTDQLDYENPSYDTIITVNGIEVPINIGITQSPLGEDWPFPVPECQSGIHLDAAIDMGSPFPSDDGQTTYFPHTVYMHNSGDSVVHANSVLQQLDPRFTYVEGSYNGFEADIIITYVDGYQELYIDFDAPLPTLVEGQAAFVSFLASTDEEIADNTFFSSGSVGYAAFDADEGELFFGEYSPSTIGYYYDIEANVGAYTILVNAGITEEGEVIVLSWQIQ
ncbi:hypothetical protein ACFLTB_02220 [Chloroflexota bacterium]